MYEFLKPLFVAEGGAAAPVSFEQFVANLEARSEIKLVNLSDGGYVSKQKYDARGTELSGVKEQLTAANETIQSYKDMDIDGIKASAASWEEKYNTDTAALNAKLEQQELAHKSDLFLAGYKFTSAAARNGIRSLFDQQNFKLGDDGVFQGAKEWMDQQVASEENKGAFVVETPPNPNPNNPNFAPNKPPQPPTKRKTLSELMDEKNKNPNATITFD